MFNGCTMRRIFNSYRLDPLESGGVKPAETHDSYESKLNVYTKTINDITSALIDWETGNDDKAKEAWEKMINDLNASFNEEVKNHFIKNPDKLIAFEKVISEAIRKLKENNRDEYKPLKDFLNKIKSIFPTINTEDASHTVDVNHTVVDLSLNEDVKLDWIEEWEEDKREKKFFKWIDETDGQSLSKLGETIKDIKEQNDIIAAITAIGTSKIPGEIMEKVKGLKDLFVNINNVINNTSPNNVKILQNYIFNNLSVDDQELFKQNNKYNGKEFDWKFWESTLDWLNIVLEKTRTYLEDVNKKFGSVEDPKYAEVKANENVNIQLNWDVDLKKLVNNLPDWATVALADWQTLQTDKPWNFKVKVNVLVWGNVVKSFDVNVKVGNNTETVPVQPTLNTDPCETYDGNKHLVIKNTPNIVQNTKLYWATFYSLANFEGNHEEWQPWSTVESVPDANGDYECLMKMKNATEVYKVKIDRTWNLCPVIENYSSKKRVLLKNNPSCVAYLQNKIPAGLPWNPKIDWHSWEEDYVIKTTINWKQKIMTIEPMQIDWHGVSPDLSEHLIMMNFVHFLRLNNTIDDVDFNNKDDPDLRLNDRGKLEVRVDRKSNRTYDKDGKVIKKGRWYEVPESPDRFWLGRITENREEKFKNLIKFNNGEHWEDNWDKKKENKYYDKITLKGEAEVISQPINTGNVVPNPNNTGNVVPNPNNTGNVVPNPNNTGNVVPNPNNTGNTIDTPTPQETKSIDVSKLEPDVLNKLKDNGVIKWADDKYTYDSEKLNSYLSEFKDKSRSELATDASYIAAVQILLNEKSGANDEKLEVNWKFDESTQGKVRKFQEEYNKSSNIKLKPDGKPGKYTLAALLGNELNTSETPSTINNGWPVNAEIWNPDPENVTKYGLRWNKLSSDPSKKVELGIPRWKNVYTREGDGKFYYKEGDKFYAVDATKPCYKYKAFFSWKDVKLEATLNYCKAWESLLNSKVRAKNSMYRVVLSNGSYNFSCPTSWAYWGDYRSTKLTFQDVYLIANGTITNDLIDRVYTEAWKTPPSRTSNNTPTNNPSGTNNDIYYSTRGFSSIR